IQDIKTRPVDFMPICGRVVSKPGFGTFAEATKLGVPIVSVTRDNFAEAAYLIKGISDYNYHQILTPAELFESSWEFLKQPLEAPRCKDKIAIDGNEVIAQTVVDFFEILLK
ncbi:MAG: glycosyl transferase, partial [Rivularia sp. (in: cyanobacteria)]